MDSWLGDALVLGTGPADKQTVELLAAFVLTALIGLERTLQGKSAGLRTQSIVGMSAALSMLVSKYGFGDVLSEGTSVLDPSRVAAQIVSGVGFLGAGIIITRRGAVHGLTTAAAVWESAAIGMAAGAGLLFLAVVVVVLHFVSTLGLMRAERRLSARVRGSIQLHVVYEDGRGVLRRLLHACGERNWQLTELTADARGGDPGQIGVMMMLSGSRIFLAKQVLSDVDGVAAVIQVDDEPW